MKILDNLFKCIYPPIQTLGKTTYSNSCHRFQLTQIGSYSTRDKSTDRRDWVNTVTKVWKSASSKPFHMWNANTVQVRHRATSRKHTRFCQTLLSTCLLFPQEESVCSMRSQSRLTTLSMLQSDSLSDWSICSSFCFSLWFPYPGGWI